MNRLLIAYFSSGLVFLALDALWIVFFMGGVYKTHLGPLLLDSPRLLPAAAFYASFVVGIVVFAVLPGIEAQQWQRAALLGALFGLLAYGAYDLTNLATLKGWSLQVALLDMAWGAVSTAAGAAAGWFALSAWGGRGA